MRSKTGKIALLASALALAASGPPAAAISEGNGRGHPDTNAAGKCPARTEQGHVTGRTEEVRLVS